MFFGSINKVNTPLAMLTKTGRFKKTPTYSNISSEWEDIMTNPTDIGRLVKHPYTYKFDTLGEMDQFLENHKFTQNEIHHLNSFYCNY